MARIDITRAFEIAPPPPDMVLPGLVAGSVGALFSPGGTGKSFLLIEACMAVACPFPHGDLLQLRPERHGRVVYFAAEDPAAELDRRIHSMGRHLDDASRAAVASALEVQSVVGKRLNLGDERRLKSIVRDVTGARLVVFDTLSRVHRLDENSAGDMGYLMGALEHLATECGAAVVFAHHVSKGAAREGYGDQQHAARGSSVLIDNARWAASLCKMTCEESQQYKREGHGAYPVGEDRKHSFVRLSFPKSNYSPPGADLWFERTGEGVLLPASLINTRHSPRRPWSPGNPGSSPGRSRTKAMAAGLGDHRDWE